MVAVVVVARGGGGGGGDVSLFSFHLSLIAFQCKDLIQSFCLAISLRQRLSQEAQAQLDILVLKENCSLHNNVILQRLPEAFILLLSLAYLPIASSLCFNARLSAKRY